MSTPRTRNGFVCLIGVLALAGCGTQQAGIPTPSQPSDSQTSSEPSPSTPEVGPPATGPGQADGSTSNARPEPGGAPSPSVAGTIPPPPMPTGPAPTRAGSLDSASVPVPPGWAKTALPGGTDQGFLGNGTWVHAQSPVNAAYETLAVGCKPVDLAAYAPPKAALAGTLTTKSGQPGNAEMFEFADPAAARAWYEQFLDQLRACAAPGSSPQVTVQQNGDQFVGKRDYGSGQLWTEFGKVSNTKVALYILADPAYASGDAEATLAKVN